MKIHKVTALICLLPVSVFNAVTAQTCSGSLGDPVVNITFGSGASSEKPLPAGVTTYNYSGNICPDDGFYTIGSTSISCFGDTWHTVSEDHTPGDIAGNMMIVNASLQAGDFFIQKVTGLCGGTSYEFSSWILNILKRSSCSSNGIDPDITFTIETTTGILVGKYTTGSIPETQNPEWKQYGFYFTAPPDADELVIRMTNNSSGGCGNDLALDDITFRACGPSISTASQTNFSNNKLCKGKAGVVSLAAQLSPGFQDPVLQWQINRNDNAGWQNIAGATQPAYIQNIPSVNENGYQFRLAISERFNSNAANCRIYSDPLKVEISPEPAANAGEDLSIIEGGTATLAGIVQGDNLRYFWTPAMYLDNPQSLNPRANPPEDIIYTLNVVSDDGCNTSASDQVSIRVLKKLIIPTAFTPNGDAINDRWRITALDSYPEARIRVYNRYGQVVFKDIGYSQHWDGSFNGKPLPAGVYYYLIDLKTLSLPVLKGAISIIR